MIFLNFNNPNLKGILHISRFEQRGFAQLDFFWKQKIVFFKGLAVYFMYQYTSVIYLCWISNFVK